MQTARLSIPADEHRLGDVRDFVARACEPLQLPGRFVANVRLAVDETCTNVIKHAYAGRTGEIHIEIAAKRGWLDIRILDQGAAFDGRVTMPQLGALIDSKRKGGLGVFLMHRLMDEVAYQSTPAGNEWRLRKRLPRSATGFGASMRRRYATRAALVLAAVLVAACTPLGIHEARQRERAEVTALRTMAFGLAETARPVLLQRQELSPEQTRLFEAVHAALRQEKRLLTLQVVDPEGLIWAADRADAAFTRFASSVPFGKPDADGVRRARVDIESEPVLYLEVPVRLDAPRGPARELGTIHIGMRWRQTRDAIRAAQWRLAAIAGALFGLGMLAVAALLGHFLLPVQRLVDGVRSLGQGSTTLSVEGPEEIGAIASAFNEMSARYQAAQASMQEHERLQKDVQVASEIQSSILPQTLPEIPGYDIARLYQPAQAIGGDYYDFLDAGHGRTGIVVADVAGKGVSASLVMTMLRTALRMEARGNGNAGDVLARMHEFLSADMRKGMFVTMFYVVLDARQRVVSYASAGHTPMILYRAATGETAFLNPRGMPVGIATSDRAFFQRQLDVERLHLRPGDMLVLYTDGITEAASPAGEQFGETRLLEAVRRLGRASAGDLVDGLWDELRRFTAGAAQQDDVTLVAIQEKRADDGAGDLVEKLGALVETEGLSVVDACRRLKVSPSTYYRFRRQAEEADRDLQQVGRREAAIDAAVAPSPAAGDARLSGDIDTPLSGCARLRLHGCIDSGSCETLEALLRQAASESVHVVVDLSDIAYVSSRGWGLLVSDPCGVRRRGGDVLLCGMRRELSDVYRMLGFEKVVPAHADAAAALATLHSVSADAATPPAAPAPAAPASDAAAGAPAVSPTAVAGAAVATGASNLPQLLENLADLDGEWESLRIRAATVGPDGLVTVVALQGILDTVSAFQLERVLGDIVAGGARRLVVDLSGLEFVSSAGWGSFNSHLPQLRADGGDLKLFGLRAGVARIFRLLQLDRVLEVHDVLGNAIASFGIVLEAAAEESASTVETPPESAASPASPAMPQPASQPEAATATPATTGASASLATGGLRAQLSPVGASGAAEIATLEGAWDAAAASQLGAWLCDTVRATLLLVDLRSLSQLDAGTWSALADARTRLAARGVRLHVLAADAALATAPADWALHATLDAALRADQQRTRLRRQRSADTVFHRDHEVRQMGWSHYLTLLRDTKEAA